MEADFDILFAYATNPKSFGEFFDALTREQAEAYLQAFLAKRDECLDYLWSCLQQESVVETPEVVFEEALLDRITDWVIQRAQEEGRARFFEAHGYPFSAELKRLMVGVGYYLGECMIRKYRDFRWKVGDRPVRRYVMQNVPVVSNQTADYDGSDICPILGVIGRCFTVVKMPNKPRIPFSQWMAEFVERARGAR